MGGRDRTEKVLIAALILIVLVQICGSASKA